MARQVGKNAALYISTDNGSTWAWVADLYDWVLEVRTVTLAARIKGDVWDRRVPSHSEGRLTARRYVEVGAATVLAFEAASANNSLNGSSVFVEGRRLQWAVMGADSGFPAGGSPTHFDNTLFSAQGSGYVDRGHMGAPRQQLEDDFELIVDSLVSMT